MPHLANAAFDPALLLDYVNDAVIIVGADWRIQQWNPAAAEIYGWEAAETLGQPISAIIPVVRYLDGGTLESAYDAIIRTSNWRGRVVQHHRNGNELSIDASVRAVCDEQGAIVALIAINRDVTDRARLANDNVELLAEAQRARAEAEAHQQRLAFLAEASALLASSLDEQTTLAHVVQLAVPLLADLCVVHLLDTQQQLMQTCVHHQDPEKVQIVEQLSRYAPPTLPPHHPLIVVLSTAAPLLLADIDLDRAAATVPDAAYLELLQRLDPRAVLIIPLVVRGTVIGTLSLTMTTQGRRFTAADETMTLELGRRVAQAIDNAHLFREALRAREAAEHTADRMTRLQAITAALVEPRSLEKVVAVILTQSISAVGARAAAIFRYEQAAVQLGLLAAEGFSPDHVTLLETLPFSVPTVFSDAVRTAAPVFVATAEERNARYPHLGQLRQSEDQAAVALPLVADGQTIGCIGLTFAAPQTFLPEDRRFLAALAQQCAGALPRAQLIAANEAATQAKDEALALLDTLYATAPVGLAFVDTNLRYVRLNATLAEVNGLPIAAHLGHTPAEILPELAPTIEPLFRHVLETGVALCDLELEGTTPAAPGVSRVWLASYYPVRDRREALVGIGLVVLETTAQRRAAAELRASTEQLQALSRRLVEAQEVERRHIARELHDEIGQVLTGLRLSLELLIQRVAEPLAVELAPLRDDMSALMARVRALSLDLRPMMLDDLGLLPALQWHITRYTAQTQIQVALRHNGLDRRFSPEVETTVYRVVQEALTNVARYAQVDTATVRLLANGERLMVRIDDTGVGFAVDVTLATRATAGLWGMIERVRLLKGELVVEAAPGKGTHVIAEIPLEGAHGKADQGRL
jgi:PAS domain S-box-containing protein